MDQAHSLKEWIEVGAYIALAAFWGALFINALFFHSTSDPGARNSGDW